MIKKALIGLAVYYEPRARATISLQRAQTEGLQDVRLRTGARGGVIPPYDLNCLGVFEGLVLDTERFREFGLQLEAVYLVPRKAALCCRGEVHLRRG